MSARLPPWRIELRAKVILLGESEIPQHQMGSTDIKAALKTMVLSQLGASVDYLARSYVNSRLGAVARETRYEPRWFDDPKNRRVGWFCGDWEHYGIAWLPLSEEEAEALQCAIDENKKHSAQNARLNAEIAAMSDEDYRMLFARDGAVEALIKGAS